MAFFGFLSFIFGWLWSAARGIQVSTTCTLLSFLFPPLAQLYYSFRHPIVRLPTVFLCVGFLLLWNEGVISVDIEIG